MVFQTKKQASKVKRRGATFHESAVTILTPGCHFDGKLYCQGSSRIGGKIEGEIVSEGLLIIEEEACINAKVKADEAVIQGRVTGRLEASGKVELASTCRFHGDIITPLLIVNEGAEFNGTTVMTKPVVNERIFATTKLGQLKAKADVKNDLKRVPELDVG
jgi:cytoskeletal protein CcmA (bactofilin family)